MKFAVSTCAKEDKKNRERSRRIGYRNILCTKNSEVMGPIFKPFVYAVLSPAIFW